ncbi:hypothetical protein SAMN04487820_11346 [Actinopolyspora mzabensis]|uniref:Uncharacterized protein n=1 Tax=Actinopolyspora mzabensis TaxID=995066 RepID=A0A1G9EWM2_ACTMZ|nr:hypothetical protein [Actinopolyspora mzabensis]SDK80510.1 hypothetical protein SAMN04487820_11346 [Actinopolyspora mzabensis]
MDKIGDWIDGRLHWHAYVEADDSAAERSDRTKRLSRSPDRVLHTPDDAAEWLAEMTRKHAQRRRIRLLGERAWAELADEDQLSRDLERDLEVLCHGHSLYTDVPRETDRLRLHVEAVDSSECRLTCG